MPVQMFSCIWSWWKWYDEMRWNEMKWRNSANSSVCLSLIIEHRMHISPRRMTIYKRVKVLCSWVDECQVKWWSLSWDAIFSFFCFTFLCSAFSRDKGQAMPVKSIKVLEAGRKERERERAQCTRWVTSLLDLYQWQLLIHLTQEERDTAGALCARSKSDEEGEEEDDDEKAKSGLW